MPDEKFTPPAGPSGRLQKRISVGLMMYVGGKDLNGEPFQDVVHSTNISRTGASFVLHRKVEVGMDLELKFPPRPGRHEEEFVMSARIVRAVPDNSEGGLLLGVQFSRRFLRVYVPESSE
jgi:hypothetical protein